MADKLIAAYFGIGVAIPQALHTYYASEKYNQKFVPALELLVPGFSRKDPHSLHWLQRQGGNSTHPLVPPWKLKSYQILPPPYNTGLKYKFATVIGLQGTNLVYCYLMSILYGLIGFYVVRNYIHPVTNVTRSTMVYFSLIFVPLLFFRCFLLVGVALKSELS